MGENTRFTSDDHENNIRLAADAEQMLWLLSAHRHAFCRNTGDRRAISDLIDATYAAWRKISSSRE